MKITPRPQSIYHTTDEVLKETVDSLESVKGALCQKYTFPQINVNTGNSATFTVTLDAPADIAGKDILIIDISASTAVKPLKYYGGFLRLTDPTSPVSGYRVPVGFMITPDLSHWTPASHTLMLVFDKIGNNSALDNIALFITVTLWIRRDW